MRITLGQLTVWLWLGGPVLGVLGCGEEDSASSIVGPDMTTAAAAGTSRIAFIVDRFVGPDEFSDVYTIVADGSGRRRVASDLSFSCCLNWAPGGATAKIAAVSGGDIYAINANGSGKTNLTRTTAKESDPVWSPDGSKIVYTRDSEVYVMNANGSGQKNLTRSAAFDGEPNWAPDSRKIVFVSVQGGLVSISVVNVDGSGKRNLTTPTASRESSPRWSPDGRQIVFERGHDIYVMNSDGTRQINASNHPAADGIPHWSPNSAKIAFSTDRKGTGDIYVMGRYGGSKTRVVATAPGVGSAPRGWSPGGARILYESGNGFWVVNADGTNNHRVATGREPAWSR